MKDIRDMIGKEVEMFANGVRYTGVLVEVSDEEVHLKTAMQWIALPASSVGEIRAIGATMQAEPGASPESSLEGA